MAGPNAGRALAASYQTHYRSLVRVAALLLGDAEAAEEIVQDAFASVHRAPQNPRDAENTANRLRKAVISRARIQLTATLGKPPGIPAAPVTAALRDLPGLQREALVLKYYADWPDGQIADAMEISRKALNAHLHRAMSAFRIFADPGPSLGV
jgi:DNA-directed RNA polymerase specialized sigma24 family protein